MKGESLLVQYHLHLNVVGACGVCFAAKQNRIK